MAASLGAHSSTAHDLGSGDTNAAIDWQAIINDWQDLTARATPCHIKSRNTYSFESQEHREENETFLKDEFWLAAYDTLTAAEGSESFASAHGPQIAAKNDRYFFVLSENKDGRRSLADILYPDAWPSSRTANRQGSETAKRQKHELVHLLPMAADDALSLPVLRSSPDQSGLAWNAAKEGSMITLELRGELRKSTAGFQAPITAEAKCKLDPSHKHAIKSAAVRLTDPSAKTMRITFENTYRLEGDVPVPVRRDYELTPSGSKEASPGVMEYLAYDLECPDDSSMFYLEHYGLQEPDQGRVPGSYRLPIWFWLVLGGILSIVAGVAMLYAVAKRK